MAVTPLPAPAPERETTLQDDLALPIVLTEQVLNSVGEVKLIRPECAEFAPFLHQLSQKLRTVVRLTSAPSPASIYDRPIRRISADVAKNLERALTLIQKCKYTGLLRHVFLTSAADFKKVSNLLKSSIADLTWVIAIFDVHEDGANPTMPPIAKDVPILAYVWTSIASLHMNQSKSGVESANLLANYARNEPYRRVIVEEGGVSSLLRLLKDGGGSEEGQIAAATALFPLVDEIKRSRAVADELGLGFPIIVKVLGDSPMKVQTLVAELVAKVAEVDPTAKEEFWRENALKPLLSCLLMGLDLQDYKRVRASGKNNIHSIVESELAAEKNSINVNSDDSYHKVDLGSSYSDGRGSWGLRKERENESPEVVYEVKTKCALALWMLCRGSVLNSQKIASPKGLFCLSKIVETERGELQLNCLMTIMEVAEVAKHHTDFRKVAWKPTLPSAKAVVDQLLRVIKEDKNPDCQIPSIQAIGSLARIFPARETGIIKTLVGELGNRNTVVATEAAIALLEFACPGNHNCIAHSNTIIEFNGVPILMKLLSADDRAKEKGLDLLCFLSMHVVNSKALADARALRILENEVHSVKVLTPERREMFSRAMRHLMLYQDGDHPLSHSDAIV